MMICMDENVGQKMYELISSLYPICRSITGDGVRRTLNEIKKLIPIKLFEIPSGTKVFDWVVPEEWNIKDAFIKDPEGNKIVEFKENNLHVLGYSIPVNKKVNLKELKEHLFTLPHMPDCIPYRTSYYKRNWGFCISYNQMLSLKEGDYEVFIDSSLKKGSLTYAELFIKGKTEDEILISTHICHPSLCNDNLSGIAVSVYLAREILRSQPRYSYRFLFIPGTIGSIVWLAQNEHNAHKIKHGLVLACVGDQGGFTYKRSKTGNAEIDRAVERALKDFGSEYRIKRFSPFGYDERQYCSLGFNLPVGCLMRSMYGEFPQYHTSLDNLDFVKPSCLKDSLKICLMIQNILEHNKVFVNTNPKCEPHLGKRGIYGEIGGDPDLRKKEHLIMWVLSLTDGSNDLLDIAETADASFNDVYKTCELLKKVSLLKEVKDN